MTLAKVSLHWVLLWLHHLPGRPDTCFVSFSTGIPNTVATGRAPDGRVHGLTVPDGGYHFCFLEAAALAPTAYAGVPGSKVLGVGNNFSSQEWNTRFRETQAPNSTSCFSVNHDLLSNPLYLAPAYSTPSLPLFPPFYLTNGTDHEMQVPIGETKTHIAPSFNPHVPQFDPLDQFNYNFVRYLFFLFI